MERTVIEAIAAGGSTALLALFIFIMYRRDRQSSEDCLRKDRIFMEDRLTKILEKEQETRERHTVIMTELVVLLKTMNGRSK